MTDEIDAVADVLAILSAGAVIAIALGTLIGLGLLINYAYTQASWLGLFALFFGGGILVLGVAGSGLVFYDKRAGQ